MCIRSQNTDYVKMLYVQSRLSELEKQMVELTAARDELQGKCVQFSCACMAVKNASI